MCINVKLRYAGKQVSFKKEVGVQLIIFIVPGRVGNHGCSLCENRIILRIMFSISISHERNHKSFACSAFLTATPVT